MSNAWAYKEKNAEVEKAKEPPKPTPKSNWYELDGLYPYRDLGAFVGVLFFVGGVAHFSLAAASMVFGSILVVACIRASR